MSSIEQCFDCKIKCENVVQSAPYAEVDSVIIPATSGDFGVLPGHVPTVAQMRPGVVQITMNDKEVHKFFVSSGFAFTHADSSTDIMVGSVSCITVLTPESDNRSDTRE